MSYCRWSCMGGQCDVYAYDDIYGGVAIHVASQRRALTPDVPPDPLVDFASGKIDAEEMMVRLKERNKALDNCELKPIGLTRDGESWRLSHGEAAVLIADLRVEGYQIPEGVEADIREDME